MGHTRLGTLPATRKWKQVIDLIAEGASAARIAEATIDAWRQAFAKVQDDGGFREAVWWMTQMGVAGGQQNPLGYLDSAGLDVSNCESGIDFAVALSTAIEERVSLYPKRSALTELAQRALLSVVTEHLHDRQQSFMPSADDLKGAVRRLGKVKEFGEFSRKFFKQLTHECLQFFLTQATPAQIGDSRRFRTATEVGQFGRALETHCWEASEIVEKFSGEWLSKNRYEGGGKIPRETAEKFGWYAMKKIQTELEARARKDG
ncbi:MAG: hypothetical protein H0X66_10275 [Verrucomicrobia bacterium]|nr:hypothetical protein [Verrucomicrobiota bacterium]